MGYDLDFWKYESEPGNGFNHQDVYEKLSDGKVVTGLETLPINNILSRISDVFESDGWHKLDELNWESENGAFQIFTTSQFVRIDCYGMNGDDMNKFIDVATEFGCPLYDPQVGNRFTISS